jgi:hypothetical protein
LAASLLLFSAIDFLLHLGGTLTAVREQTKERNAILRAALVRREDLKRRRDDVVGYGLVVCSKRLYECKPFAISGVGQPDGCFGERDFSVS